jgi:hypothetical protein
MPNEDAQSFVFDTTSLFERDKFSGFDGPRAAHAPMSACVTPAASTTG